MKRRNPLVYIMLLALPFVFAGCNGSTEEPLAPHWVLASVSEPATTSSVGLEAAFSYEQENRSVVCTYEYSDGRRVVVTAICNADSSQVETTTVETNTDGLQRTEKVVTRLDAAGRPTSLLVNDQDGRQLYSRTLEYNATGQGVQSTLTTQTQHNTAGAIALDAAGNMAGYTSSTSDFAETYTYDNAQNPFYPIRFLHFHPLALHPHYFGQNNPLLKARTSEGFTATYSYTYNNQNLPVERVATNSADADYQGITRFAYIDLNAQ